ncbi:ATP synthase mitochondrial F1 complex assembly factor 1-like isoform X2 [Thrips palmi]|uniref:ATP synthase mitochondrial F1 complex assembly factor 1-like isoform X2 n=1 Tax=Thrips palmi TaxID=161013 RepID=A0A6P9A3J6_THRPL|nr:ATP synthase mitochondrial F1 complex assembly factor 1-like isoform X2 [Thrips palmi]
MAAAAVSVGLTLEMVWCFRGVLNRGCSMIRSTPISRVQCKTFSVSGIRCKDNEDMNSLKTNPYFDKYSQKISQLEKSTPEELSQRITAIRRKAKSFNSRQGESQATSSNETSPFSKKKSLDDIVKLDLLKKKSPQEITDIWLQHFASAKDSISVVISAKVYSLILDTKSNHPTFLLPLPRQHGYEYFVSQSCGNEFHFTPLINYQTFKENAPECLALTHFTELANDKDIVLMQGEFNDDVLNISEAMCLTNQIHRYYGENDIKRQNLLARFSNSPEEFRHMDLIVELERLAS